MVQLFCPSPAWDVDDFNSCLRERYFNVLYPLIAVLGSLVYLVLTSTIRLPKFLRRKWFKNGYTQLPTHADDDSETEIMDPIYRLRTTDAGAEYDEIADTAERDIEDEAADQRRAQNGDHTSPALILSVTPARRLRSVIEEVVAIMLTVVHLLTWAGIFVIQYPPYYSERVVLSHYCFATSVVSVYVLLLSTLRLSPNVRYNSPFLRLHVALFYVIIWAIATVNFRSALIHPSRDIVIYISTMDFLSYSTLLAISLMSPVHDRPAYIETVDGLEPNPVPYSSIFQIMTFSWADSLLKKGYKQPLHMDDVWDLKDDCRSVVLMPGYRAAKNGGTMLYGLLKYFQPRLLHGLVFSVLYAIFTFTPTILVRQILRHLEDPSKEPAHMAWLYVFLLLVFAFINASCSAQALWTFREVCVRARAVIVAELYSKALKRKVATNVADGAEAAAVKAKRKAKEEAETGEVKKEKIEDESIDLGRVINLMAVDAFSIAEVLARLNPLIKGTLMIFISMILLYQTLGASAIAGSLCMLTLLPINYKFSRTFGKIQKELLGITDRRIQKTNEILQSIKIIKFFAWEDRFKDSLQEIRNEELRTLRRRFLILAFAAMIWFGFPTIITFITFGFYTMVAKKELTASVAFSSLSLFNLMRTPMDRLAEMITNVIEARTSVERVQKFLDEEETQKYAQLTKSRRGHGDPVIGFSEASFAWGDGSTNFDFKLQDLSIAFEPGKLSVIVGPTGAGKSSLLLALLGEMNILKGKVFLPCSPLLEQPVANKTTGLTDTVAYCAQQPWLLNDTIRENILFGNKYVESRYANVVKLCALVRDFQILDAGDMTQVGEKGISLSGGQKQRISLARALYSPAKHLILDDCLSAVDSHTALFLYENCITGPLMKDRTCILVSHNVALTLTLASKVIVLENGRVVAQGPPVDVVASGVLGSDELLMNSIQNSRDVSRVPSSTDIAQVNKDAIEIIDAVAAEQQNAKELSQKVKKKTNEELQQVGMVKLGVYFSYVKAMGGSGYWTLIVLAFVLHQATAVSQSWWVRVWSAAISSVESFLKGETFSAAAAPANFSASGLFEYSANAAVDNAIQPLIALRELEIKESKGPQYYLAIYGFIAIVYVALSFVREALFYLGSLSASKRLFDNLLNTVMRAKPRFFDSTPVGRIINRFSKDIESIDREVAVDALSFIHSILSVAVVIGVISAIVPGFLLIGIVISVIFFLINMFYLQSSRELKRMQSVTRSPIYQHFGETLVGISTIRAYGYEQRFIAESMHKVDTNSRPYWIMWALNRWMCYRTDLAGGMVAFFGGVFVLISSDKIDSGLAGLILTYAITFTENMFWVVLLYATNEMNMNSVERIDEFLAIEQEAADIIPDSRPPKNWPSKGAITVKDLSLRYAPELPRVIKGISFDVEPCSKIGIVGRTGAGKSTIASAFFRFLEADTGNIVIDGIDIAKIGLRDLRQGLTIIPQDPTLFTGTIRTNLDPFGTYSDKEIFTALRHVHLIDVIPGEAPESSTGRTELEQEAYDMNVFYRLDSAVTEGGGNLSQGQRQLMCLARSLLRSPKIILLDEATASIDYHTDAQIQETIRTEFSQTTILTIAHRLRSIIDYDKILVLDSGLIKEYAAPHLLLQQEDSIFRSMCASSGELEALEELAKQAYDKRTPL